MNRETALVLDRSSAGGECNGRRGDKLWGRAHLVLLVGDGDVGLRELLVRERRREQVEELLADLPCLVRKRKPAQEGKEEQNEQKAGPELVRGASVVELRMANQRE